MQNNINFRETRDFGDLINITFEFIKENFWPLFKALLYIAGPFVLISGIFTSTIVIKMLLKYPPNSHVSLFDLAQHMSSYSLVNYIFMFVTNSVIAGVVYEYVYLYVNVGAGNFTFSDLVESLQTDAFTLIGVFFLSTILITAGFLLFLLPGIYLAVILSPIIMVTLFESLSFPEAFERSRSLISGYWWFTFGYLIVILIIQTIIMMAISIPLNIISEFIMGAASGTMSKSSQIALIITSVISSVNYFLYGIPMIAMAFHYFNLVERKDNIGYIE